MNPLLSAQQMLSLRVSHEMASEWGSAGVGFLTIDLVILAHQNEIILIFLEC